MCEGDYALFLGRKRLIVPACGKWVEPGALSPVLFPFQRDLVSWALRKGRAALLATTGMGKTLMQLEWARHAAERVLILAPLAVAGQTVREGEKFGIPVSYARGQTQAAERGITITNYEMLSHFDPSRFGAVVLDESSILKSFEGKTRTALIEAFRETPLRLCCTATPAPNDIAEIANHAAFLSVMSREEMLAAFFVHDDQGWRLKGHARRPFYRWLASWGMSLTRPSDLGYSDEGYALPELAIRLAIVGTDYAPPGRLFCDRLQGVTERAAVRRGTIEPRVEQAAALVQSEPREPWIAWVGLNEEGRALQERLGDGVLVEGSQSPDEKAARLEAFAAGEARVLITKPTIAGFGLNLQRCARMVFVGLSDSYEQYFQCLRRCWRYGQTRDVVAYVVLTEPEQTIYQNVLAKEREAVTTAAELVRHVADFERAEIGGVRQGDSYAARHRLTLPDWLAA